MEGEKTAGNKKTLAIVALVLAILSLMPYVVAFDTLKENMILYGVAILLGVCGAVLGFISKKDAKGMAITAIVIGILSAVLFCFALLGLSFMTKATDCVDKGDGIAVCQFMGQELEVPTDFLTEDQMKKEEVEETVIDQTEPEVNNPEENLQEETDTVPETTE